MTNNASRGAHPAVVKKMVAKVLDILEHLGCAHLQFAVLPGTALSCLEELRDKVGETVYRAIYSDGDNDEVCTAAGEP